MSNAVRGCDFVLHQAALPSVPRSIQDPLTSNATNVIGTINVLLAARDHAVRRVVMASSSSVYGANPKMPKQEDDPALPISPYASAKLAGESYARSFQLAYGIETIALRYFNVFGPRQDPNSQYSAVVPRFITAFLTGAQPMIYGDGEQARDFTPIANVVQANLLAMEAPRVESNVFNIACGQQVSVNEMLNQIAAIIGVEADPIYAPARVGDIKFSRADISRAQAELGYKPSFDLRSGLEITVDHIREQRLRGVDAASSV